MLKEQSKITHHAPQLNKLTTTNGSSFQVLDTYLGVSLDTFGHNKMNTFQDNLVVSLLQYWI